ncbi:MAG: tetratricopeptide repeat protein [Deltaproteobacteria bacterium]|nr:tetratricopeptide repeat protein [Deltaproteobacteria bacterium]
MAKRYTRKELKRPDQFQTFWTRVYEFLKSTTRPLAIGALAAVVVIAGIFLYVSLRDKRRAESSKALAQALRVLNSETGPQLEDPDAAKDQHEGDVPKFKTETERRDAATKALDKVIQDWGSTAAGRDALLVRAGIYYDLGRQDDALRDYKTFLSKGPRGNLRAVAHEGLGYVYEAKGEHDRALEEFRLITSAGEFYRDRSLYNQARVMERKGDKAAAQKLYQEILDKSPTTPLRDDISNRLALLQK